MPQDEFNNYIPLAFHVEDKFLNDKNRLTNTMVSSLKNNFSFEQMKIIQGLLIAYRDFLKNSEK